MLVKHTVKQRTYLPQTFKVTVWSKLKPYFHELKERNIDSVTDLEHWIYDWCELNDVVAEEFRWRYIRFSCDNEDQKALESYNYAVQELTPRMSPYNDDLNQKLLNSPFLKELDQSRYAIYLRSVKNEIDLYQEENISLVADVKTRAKNHGRIFSKMSVDYNDQELTLQQAHTMMERMERPERAKLYKKIGERLLEDAEELEGTFDDLLQLRHQIALNTGFENYRDYKFQALNRFDYEVQDCLNFHDSIASEIVPIVDELNKVRKRMMGLDDLRPWDMMLEMDGKRPDQPFKTTRELIQKSVKSLRTLNPMFGEVLELMDEIGHLDLESRKGKRPGGYNMPLPLSGVPFIFMNAANSIKDMRTMMHETGHAVHAYLIKDLPLNADKNIPSEVAELAAMTMELLTLDFWGEFYEDEKALRRAKIWQLEKVLSTLPWVATIDKFQHWLYTNPEHSTPDRINNWLAIHKEFSSPTINMDGLEESLKYMWHRQLHIFEVPFYYVEYGMAQLGAIAIWKQYKENPQQALNSYIKALSLGYTKSIPEIYEAAGIEFNFSREYVRELGLFVKQELEELIFN